MQKIEELEYNDTVVCAIQLDNGTVLCMDEMLMDKTVLSRTIALGTVSIEEYEENGYECDGLDYIWIKL